MTVRKRRVTWTEEEWDDLTAYLRDRRLANARDSLTAFYDDAMKRLPENRRRPIQGPVIADFSERVEQLVSEDTQKLAAAETEIAKLQDTVEKLQAKLESAPKVPDKEEIVSKLTDHEILTRFGTRVLKQMTPAELGSHFAVSELLESLPTEQLVSAAIGRVFHDVEARQVHIANMLQQVVQHSNGGSTTAPKAHAKKKVLLIGFKRNQVEEIKLKFGHRAKFEFIDEDRRGAIPHNVALILVFASFVSHHGVLDQVEKAAARGVLVEYVKGGVSSAKTLLDTRLP